MPSKIDLNLIRVFLVVYRCGSISTAVKQLHMTQPAISNALRRLTNLIDCPLFLPKGRNIQATPEAKNLYDQLSDPYETIQQALSGFNVFDVETTNREFVVALSSYFDHMMPNITTVFEQTAPQAKLKRISYDFENNRKELVEGSLDLMLTAVNRLPSDLNSLSLGTDKLVLVSRKNHPLLKSSKSLKVSTMKELRFVSLIQEHEEAMPAYFIQYEMGISIYIRVPSFINLIDITQATNHVALLPKFVADHYKELVNIYDLPIQSPTIDLKIAWGHHNTNNLAHCWIRELINDTYSEYA